MTIHNRARALLLFGLTVLLVVGVTAALILRAEEGQRNMVAAAAEIERDHLQAIRHRIVISSAAFATLTFDLAEVAGLESRTDGTARAELEAATAQLREIVDRGELPEPEATLASDTVGAADRALAAPGNPWAMEEVAYVATAPGSRGTASSVADVHLLASVLATSPSLIALDGLTLDLWNRGVELQPEVADYVESTASIVLEDPGWYGPDVESVLSGGYLPGEELDAVDPGLADQLESAVGLDAVWAYDQWLIFDADGDTPSPSSLDELVATASRVQADMVDRVLAGLDAEIALVDVDGSGVWLKIGWIGGIVIAALAFLALCAVLIIRTRRLAAAVLVDPLTGVANRRRLEHLAEEWSSTNATTNAVVVVDLDRFKLINDTLGHAAGDAVLRLVATGLVTAAEDLCGPNGRSEVVRLGGDEFALVIAEPRETDETRIRARVESIDGTVDIGEGTVEVGLSVGVVVSDGPSDLDGLLAAADLRTYERKQARRTSNPPSIAAEVTA